MNNTLIKYLSILQNNCMIYIMYKNAEDYASSNDIHIDDASKIYDEAKISYTALSKLFGTDGVYQFTFIDPEIFSQ